VLATKLEQRIAFDLRGSWQARALAQIKGPARAVLMSVLAHTLDEAMPTLCAVVFPDFDGSIVPPYLTTAAKIDKSGAIVADICDRDGFIYKDQVIFESEHIMRDAFRRFADRLKLNDADRIEMFKYAQAWVVADRRLDPNFDPRDPDAKRLVN
jgi:hypothetical protein